MRDGEAEPTQAPATWENVVVGKAKQVIGKVTGDDALAAEGEDQEVIAEQIADESRGNGTPGDVG